MADLINQQIRNNNPQVPPVTDVPETFQESQSQQQQEQVIPNVDFPPVPEQPRVTPFVGGRVNPNFGAQASVSLPDILTSTGPSNLFSGPSRFDLDQSKRFIIPELRPQMNPAERSLTNPNSGDNNTLYDSTRSLLDRTGSLLRGIWDIYWNGHPNEVQYGDFGKGNMGALFYVLANLFNVPAGAVLDIRRNFQANVAALGIDNIGFQDLLTNPFNPNNVREFIENLQENDVSTLRDLPAFALGVLSPGATGVLQPPEYLLNSRNQTIASVARRLGNGIQLGSQGFQRRREQFYEQHPDRNRQSYLLRAFSGEDLDFLTFQRQVDGDYSPLGILGDESEFPQRTRLDQYARVFAGFGLGVLFDPSDRISDLGNFIRRTAPTVIDLVGDARRLLPGTPNRPALMATGLPPFPDRPALPPAPIVPTPSTQPFGRHFRTVQVDGLPNNIRVQVLDDVGTGIPDRVQRTFTVDVASELSVTDIQPYRNNRNAALQPQLQPSDIIRRIPGTRESLNIRLRQPNQLRRLINTFTNIAPSSLNRTQLQDLTTAIGDKNLRDYLAVTARPLGRPVPLLRASRVPPTFDFRRLAEITGRRTGEFTRRILSGLRHTVANPQQILELPPSTQRLLQDFNVPLDGRFLDNSTNFSASMGGQFYLTDDSFYKIFDFTQAEDFSPESFEIHNLVLRQTVNSEIEGLLLTRDIPYIPNLISVDSIVDEATARAGYLIQVERVDGITMNEFLKRHGQNPIFLREVFEDILAKQQDLFNRGFVHTDLQGGNIIVKPDNTVSFIDVAFIREPTGIGETLLDIDRIFTVALLLDAPERPLVEAISSLTELDNIDEILEATPNSAVIKKALNRLLNGDPNDIDFLNEVVSDLPDALRPLAVLDTNVVRNRLRGIFADTSIERFNKALQLIRRADAGSRPTADSLLPIIDDLGLDLNQRDIQDLLDIFDDDIAAVLGDPQFNRTRDAIVKYSRARSNLDDSLNILNAIDAQLDDVQGILASNIDISELASAVPAPTTEVRRQVADVLNLRQRAAVAAEESQEIIEEQRRLIGIEDVDEAVEELEASEFVEELVDEVESLQLAWDRLVDDPTLRNLENFKSQLEYYMETMVEDAFNEATRAYDLYEEAKRNLEEIVNDDNRRFIQEQLEDDNAFHRQRDLDLGNGNRNICL